MRGYFGRVVERVRERWKLREAAVGLNLAVHPFSPDTPGSQMRFVDRHGRELGISPGFVRSESRERLHAILAAFAAGATEIKWIDGTVLVLDVAKHTIHVVGPHRSDRSGGKRSAGGGHA